MAAVIRKWGTCIESMASQSYPDAPNFFYSDFDHQKNRLPNPVRLGLMLTNDWNELERLEKIARYSSYVRALVEYSSKTSGKSKVDFIRG